MKKMLVITVILAMVLLLSVPMQVEASRTYTDFENGLEYWLPSTTTGGTVQISVDYAHSGTHSLEEYARSSGYEVNNSIVTIRLPITSALEQYELTAWVYVTARSDASATSFFGFDFDGNFVGWDVWGSQASYLWHLPFARSSVSYGLTLGVWHEVKVAVYTNSGKVSVWLDNDLIVDNQPAFVAGERPTYYHVGGWANNNGVYTIHQFVDDISVNEPSENPFWMQWWFWTLIALGVLVVVLAFTTVHYRKKPSVSKEPSVLQSKTIPKTNKVCPKCGANLPADSKFCGKCGTSLE